MSMDMNNLFYNEFNAMQGVLRGCYSAFNIMGDLRGFLPDDVLRGVPVDFVGDLVYVSGVDDKYYGKLNGHAGYVYTGVVKRRRVDASGLFLKDSKGNQLYEGVVCPRGSVVVGFEGLSIGVPYQYEKEGYSFVDVVQLGGLLLYMYIVPREFCYKANQTALVLSYTKPRLYYSCAVVTLSTGHFLYVGVVPMDRRKWSTRAYRVLRLGVGLDYADFVQRMVRHWVGTGLMFNPGLCGFDEDVRGRLNMAYQTLGGGIAEYRKFDRNVTLAFAGDREG